MPACLRSCQGVSIRALRMRARQRWNRNERLRRRSPSRVGVSLPSARRRGAEVRRKIVARPAPASPNLSAAGGRQASECPPAGEQSTPRVEGKMVERADWHATFAHGAVRPQ
eukprot:scaffold55825_cov27-Tisochrysis_lutea.AAC.9